MNHETNWPKFCNHSHLLVCLHIIIYLLFFQILLFVSFIVSGGLSLRESFYLAEEISNTGKVPFMLFSITLL